MQLENGKVCITYSGTFCIFKISQIERLEKRQQSIKMGTYVKILEICNLFLFDTLKRKHVFQTLLVMFFVT